MKEEIRKKKPRLPIKNNNISLNKESESIIDDLPLNTNIETKDEEKNKDDAIFTENNIVSNDIKHKDFELSANDKLKKVIIDINKSTEGVIVFEDGKKYTKVSQRVKAIRDAFGFDIRIISIIKDLTASSAWAEAQLWMKVDGNFELIQTANAFEEKSTSHINKHSFLEVAETSAIGRCLAFLGVFGDEFSSIDELNSTFTNKDSTVKKPTSLRRTEAETIKDKNKDKITEEQLKFFYDFLKENKTYTLASLLDDCLDSNGKQISKLEELNKKDSDRIYNILKLSKDEIL